MMAKKKTAKKAVKKPAKKTVKKTAKAPATPVDFGTAFKFPFNRWLGLLNILWVLIPIIGWFALIGYVIRIAKGFIAGKFDQTPKMNFVSDMVFGFLMCLKSLPFIIVYVIIIWLLNLISPALGGLVNLLLVLFAIPILAMNFFDKETVKSFFELPKINAVFSNFGDYIIVLLKSLLLTIVFGILSIILIGIPANTYTRSIFLADFYRRNAK